VRTAPAESAVRFRPFYTPSGGVESIARQGALGLAQDAERASVEAEPFGKALGLLRGQAGEGVAGDDQLCSC
jgi:hypothetical protein